MTQEDCFDLPHHATHLGVCYPGDAFEITLGSVSGGTTVWHDDFHAVGGASVPEPGSSGLFVLALAMWLVLLRRRRSA
jgi:hypothetical protein